MTTLGIDPGKSGGIAIFQNGELLGCERMPLASGTIDVSALQQIIIENRAESAVIEKQHTRGGQGGNLTIGANYGRILAVLELCGVPYREVHPSKWTAKIRQWLANDLIPVSKDKKALSATYCQHMGYDVPVLRSGRLHDGCTDAVCIGKYGMVSHATN